MYKSDFFHVAECSVKWIVLCLVYVKFGSLHHSMSASSETKVSICVAMPCIGTPQIRWLLTLSPMHALMLTPCVYCEMHMFVCVYACICM